MKPYNFTNLTQSGGVKTKLQNNINAVKLLRQLEQSQRFPTEIERDILAKFTGWGTVASAINREVLDLLPNTDLNSDNAFQTPRFIIEAVWEILEQLGFKSGRIADPAANIGLWASFQNPEYRTNSEWLLVEIDPTAKAIAQYLHPDAIVYGSNAQQQIGFEHTDIPKDSFDLVVSNFPFGVTPPFDPKYQKVVKTLHNYFWAKSLALTTPGGIIASITSVGTMDSTPEFCQYLASQGARLIGAVRLPNTAFKSMNTSVTADLIILQKMTEPQNAVNWGEVVDSPIKDRYNVPLKINRYFAENPDKLLGELTKCVLYAGERIAVAGDSHNLKQRIIDAFSNIEPCYTPPKHVKSLSQNLLPAEFVGLDPYRYVSRQGKIYQYRPGEGLCLVTQNTERIAAGLRLKQTLDNLVQAEIKEAGEQGAGEKELLENGNLCKGDKEISTSPLPTPYSLLPTPLPRCEILRSELNRLYHQFVKQYGELLNRRKRPSTLSVFSDDSELTTLCYALEEEIPADVDLKEGKVKGVRYKKADIFTTRISGNLRKRDRKISSPLDAVYDCLDRKGYLDLKFIALLLDKTEEDTIATLKAVEIPNHKARETANHKAGETGNQKAGEIPNHKAGETGNLNGGKTTNPKAVEICDRKLVETSNLNGGKTTNPKLLETTNNKQSFIFYDIQLQHWVTRDEYLSGDTRAKLQICRTCKDIDPEAYNKFWLYDNETQLTKKDEFGKYLHLSPYLLPPASETIRAEIAHRLKANSDIDSHLESTTYIDGSLGVPWVESEQIAQFIAKILHSTQREVRVCHVPELGLWSVTGKPSCREAAIKSEYAANGSDGKGSRDVFWLIEQTLNQSPIKIQVFDNETLDRKASTEATDIAIAQIERLKKEFKEWLWSDIERAYNLTVKYNKLYPLPQKRIFDGSYLSLPDSNTKIQLKPHQLNGIARAIQTKRLLTLWEVGTGKSYQIFASAYESQRLGIAQKPIIVALNSTLSQMVAGFRNLYPHVKLLVIDDNIAGRSTGNWQERNKLIAKIQTGRYDAILLTHTQFFSIPISNQTKLHYIREQLELVERYLAEAKGDKSTRSLGRELRRQQESLHQQIDELEVMEKVSMTDANSPEFQELVLDLLAEETLTVNANGCLEYVKASKRSKSKQSQSQEVQFADSQVYQEAESKEIQVTDSQFYQETQSQETESKEIQVSDSQLYQETQSQETQFADSQLYQETESKLSQFADSQLYQKTESKEIQVTDSQLYQETESKLSQFADSQFCQETQSKESQFADSQLYQETQSKESQFADSQLYQETESKEIQVTDSQLYQETQSQETQFADSQLYQETESKETQFADSQLYQKTQSKQTQVTDSQLYQKTKSKESEFPDSQLYQETQNEETQFPDSQLYQETESKETRFVDSQPYQEAKSKQTQVTDSRLYQENQSQLTQVSDSQLYQEAKSKQTQVTDSQTYQKTQSQEPQIPDNQISQKTQTKPTQIPHRQLSQKQRDKKRDSLNNSLERATQYYTRNSVAINWEDLGCQWVWFDEIHAAKNIPFASKAQGIAGITNVDTQRSLNTLLKYRFMFDKGYFIGGGTGTLPSNSLTEVFNMMRLFCPDLLHSTQTEHFDSWLGQYGEITTSLEFTSTGGIKSKTRVASFKNLWELMSSLSLFTDFVTADSAKIERPILHRHTITAPMNGTQLAITQNIKYWMERWQRKQPVSYCKADGTIVAHNPLTLTSLGSLSSIDSRLVEPNAVVHKETKLHQLIHNVLWIYRATDERLGTQIIFSDSGVPKGIKRGEFNVDNSGVSKGIKPGEFNVDNSGVSKAVKRGEIDVENSDVSNVSKGIKPGEINVENSDVPKGIKRGEINVENSDVPKGIKPGEIDVENSDVSNVSKGIKPGEINVENSDVPKAIKCSKFDVYNYIRDTLVALGIPANQIAFIHEFDTEAKRLKLYDNVNRGRIRILLGSTLKAGTGINVQRLCIALHHLDLSWTPANLIQRRGRGHRQGNLWPEIWEFTYGTSGLDNSPGFDAYKANLVRLKAEMSYRIMSGNVQERHCEDVGEDASHFLMAAAILSGNSAALDHAKITSKIRQKEADLVNQQTTLGKSLYALKNLEQDREALAAELAAATADLAKVMAVGDLKGEGFRCQVQGIKYDSVEQAGNALIQVIYRIIQSRQPCFDEEIGEIAGLAICVTYIGGDSVHYVRLRGAEFMGNSGKQNTFYHLGNWNTGRGLISCLRDTLKDIKGENNSGITIAENLAKKLEQFNRDAERLPEMVSRLTQVVSGIKAELAPLKVEEFRLRHELVKVSEGEDVLDASESSEISIASEDEDVSEISIASAGKDVSEISTVSAGEDVSEISTASAGEDVSEISIASAGEDVSEISIASAGEDVSEISTVSAGKDVSEISTVSAGEDASGISTASAGKDAEKLQVIDYTEEDLVPAPGAALYFGADADIVEYILSLGEPTTVDEEGNLVTWIDKMESLKLKLDVANLASIEEAKQQLEKTLELKTEEKGKSNSPCSPTPCSPTPSSPAPCSPLPTPFHIQEIRQIIGAIGLSEESLNRVMANLTIRIQEELGLLKLDGEKYLWETVGSVQQGRLF